MTQQHRVDLAADYGAGALHGLVSATGPPRGALSNRRKRLHDKIRESRVQVEDWKDRKDWQYHESGRPRSSQPEAESLAADLRSTQGIWR